MRGVPLLFGVPVLAKAAADDVAFVRALHAALSRGALRLHAWVYTIESGEVFAYDPEEGQYARIEGQLVPVVQGKRATIRPWS